MNDSTTALSFPLIDRKPVTASFDGGQITSNAGVLLVAKADRKLAFCEYLAGAVRDTRQPGKVRHSILDLLRERIFAIATGHEDANDLDSLADDPALRISCGRRLGEEDRLASQPTISRLEKRLQRADVLEMAKRLAEISIEQIPAAAKRLVLDVDASEDPCHGQQEFEYFNAHYGSHCYLPLFLHVTAEGDRQRLLGALLRAGNAGSETGLCSFLRRAVDLIDARFAGVPITLRADAGFGHAEEIHFCEDQGLDFVLGLSTNERLKKLVAASVEEAEDIYANEDGRYYAEFSYQADTWRNAYRVVARIEVTAGKANTRFVVTNFTGMSAQALYEFYCQRGEQENRIKEIKLDLMSGRTSCHRFLGNQLRLLFHAAANILLTVLQDGLAGTSLSGSQMGTLIVKLLKVGALVKESTRALRVRLASSYPEQKTWYHLSACLDGL
jgi:hypothetical protein